MQDNEDRFKLLVNSVEDYAIYMLTPDGHVLTWNRGAQVNKGFAADEVLGKHFQQFFVPEDVAAGLPQKELAEAAQDGRAAGYGWRLRKGGVRCWASYLLTAMHNDDGSLIGFAKVVRYLSEHKQFDDDTLLMQSALREERDNLDAAAESSMDALYICEAIRGATGDIEDFRFMYLNHNVEKISSVPRGKMLHKNMCELFPINRDLGLFEKYKQVVLTGEPLVDEFSIHDQDVRCTWIRVQVVKLRDGIAISASDITERKEHELHVERLAGFLNSIISSAPFAIIVTDLKGVITTVNPAAENMFGYKNEELIGAQTPLVLFDSKEIACHASVLSEELQTLIAPDIEALTAKPQLGLLEESDWKLVRKNASTLDAQLTVSPLNTAADELVGFIFTAYDITERKRNQEYIYHLANHDVLTGLPTRTLLQDRLELALVHARRHGKKLALMLLDLDNFKRVNDHFGHHTGDELLKIIASRLKSAVRASDTVARMGGDEFVILLEKIDSIRDAESMAAKIKTDLEQPICINEHSIAPNASIGICCYPINGATVESLLNNADAAMYAAKAEGRHRYNIFTRELELKVNRRKLLEAGLVKALELNESQLLYQPQVNLNTGIVTGVEALLRWQSNNFGYVTPDDFIPIAEETGLILPIGEFVLRTACRDAKQLQLGLDRNLTIAVNVSPHQFQHKGLPHIIDQALMENNLGSSSLELEITEGVLLGYLAGPLDALEKIRSRGVRVAIDDFGTGFSSMSYILRFRVDRIKIDQSFVRNLSTNANNRAVTTAVIAMAKGLNISVVAEGVESEDHRDILLAEGCEETQGYFYSKPVPFGLLPAVISEIEQRNSMPLAA